MQLTLERPTQCGSTTYPVWVDCGNCDDSECEQYYICLHPATPEPSGSITAFSHCSTCDDQELCSLQCRCMKGNIITAFTPCDPCRTPTDCTKYGECQGNNITTSASDNDDDDDESCDYGEKDANSDKVHGASGTEEDDVDEEDLVEKS